MELRVLRYFLAVAREESISAAAQALHLTQPTLSRQLMDLEAEVGRPLFLRGRRITLTEHGVPHAYIVFPHSGHGLQNDNGLYALYMEKVTEYLDKYMA